MTQMTDEARAALAEGGWQLSGTPVETGSKLVIVTIIDENRTDSVTNVWTYDSDVDPLVMVVGRDLTRDGHWPDLEVSQLTDEMESRYQTDEVNALYQSHMQ